MDKPSLHEIAAMPFPASERALFQHYGVEPYRERRQAGDKQMYRVKVHYSWIETDSVTYDILASDEEDAEALSQREFENDPKFKHADYDVDLVVAEELVS